MILPGAFSGSVCGRAFVELMGREIRPRPGRFAEIRARNLGCRAGPG